MTELPGRGWDQFPLSKYSNLVNQNTLMSGGSTEKQTMDDRVVAAERISCSLVNKEEYEKCVSYVQEMLRESVDSFTLRMNEVACYINKQQWKEAVTALDSAHSIYAGNTLTAKQKELSIMYYALAEQELGDIDSAVRALEELALAKKDDQIVQFNYCVALSRKERYRDAIEGLLEIILKRPDWDKPYFSVANCYQNLGLDGEAIFWYHQALSKSDTPCIRLNLAISLLRSGRYEEGWREFENRPRSWNLGWLNCNWVAGTEIRGKSVAVITDEGVGDAIMFLPLLGRLIQDSSQHVVYTDKRLAGIFKRCFPSLMIETRVKDQRYKEYDVFMRLASLAGISYNNEKDIAGRKPYLTSDEAYKAKWSMIFKGVNRIKVGIGWRGGVSQEAIMKRSVPLIKWNILGEGLDVEWVSLQHRPDSEEVKKANSYYGVDIKLYDSLTDDLEDLTAIIDNLDLVITCEQTVAHIAGALGKKCFVLTARPPGWRYISGSDTTNENNMLWYDSITLLGQSDWKTCINYISEL